MRLASLLIITLLSLTLVPFPGDTETEQYLPYSQNQSNVDHPDGPDPAEW